MSWIIVPYVSAGVIKLGMNQAEVEKLIGAPKNTRSGTLYEKIEFRSADAPVVYYDTLGVAEIVFSRFAKEVKFLNLDVFANDGKAVLKELSSKYDDFILNDDVIISKKAGVSLTGFHDGELSQKAFGLFKDGVWNPDNLKNAKPVKFP